MELCGTDKRRFDMGQDGGVDAFIEYGGRPKIQIVKEKRLDRNIALSLTLVVLIVYGLTMCRTIYTGDDGDFETAMATGGICHPTGYPLFTLLGRLFLIVLAPVIHEPAARINLMTALFGAGAIGMFYRFVTTLRVPRSLAAMTSLILAFAPTLWQQSLSCEVYSLTCLFLCTALWLAARLAQGEKSVVLALSLVYGLALTNNLTMALFLPGFLGLALWRLGWRGVLRPAVFACFLLPLLLYASLPLAAKYGHSPLRWGDPQTWPRFFAHVSGAQYRDLMFTKPLNTFHWRLWSYLVGFLRPELGWHFLAFVPLGIVRLWKTQRPLLLLTLSVFVADVIYATNYEITDIYVYFIPSYVCVALWIAAGISGISQRLLERAWSVSHALTPMRERQARLLAVIALAIPLTQMSSHFATSDKSGNYLEADYARNLLASAPKDAVLLTTGSVTFTLWYEKWVRHNRPDVVAINIDLFLGTLANNISWNYQQINDQWPALPSPYGLATQEIQNGRYLQRLVRGALSEGRPVLFVADSRADDRSLGGLAAKDAMLKPFVRVPWGITERLYEPGTEPNPETIYTQNLALWPSFSLRGVYTGWPQNDFLQVQIPFRYFYANKAMGQLAQRHGHDDLARHHFENALRLFADKETEAAVERLK